MSQHSTNIDAGHSMLLSILGVTRQAGRQPELEPRGFCECRVPDPGRKFVQTVIDSAVEINYSKYAHGPLCSKVLRFTNFINVKL